MLAMSDINCIKFLRNHKSHSINRIAKNLDLNWRTVKKYADSAQLPSETIRERDKTTVGRKGSKHAPPRDESECDRPDAQLELEDRQKIQ